MMEELPLNDTKADFFDVETKLLAQLYFRNIYQRVHTFKFNFLGMVVGKHRTGKSTAAIQFCHALDPTFLPNIEKRVVYFPHDFMAALEDIQRRNIIGGGIVWDEAGVGLPSREWYDIANKSISYTLQVFGRYRPIVIFVSPDASYIDTQARKMFHGFFEMSRINNDFAMARPFNVYYNKRAGTKVYYHYPRFTARSQNASGATLKIKKIKIGKPFKELEERYEEHSKIFKDKIVKQMAERSKKFSSGEVDSKRMTSEEVLEDILKNKDNPMILSKRSSEANYILDRDGLRAHYDIPDSMARHLKRKAEIILNKVPEDKQILDSIPKDDEE
jgi:hypothetical protein